MVSYSIANCKRLPEGNDWTDSDVVSLDPIKISHFKPRKSLSNHHLLMVKHPFVDGIKHHFEENLQLFAIRFAPRRHSTAPSHAATLPPSLWRWWHRSTSPRRGHNDPRRGWTAAFTGREKNTLPERGDITVALEKCHGNRMENYE